MTIEDIKKRLGDSEEETRRLAVEELGKMQGEDALALVLLAMADPSWRVRKTAVEALEVFQGEKDLIPALIDALRSQDNAGLVNSAVEVLTKIGPATLPYLIGAIKDRDGDTRKFVADILGELKDRRGVPVLIETLRDSDENVRAAASEALGKIGGEEVVGVLIGFLDEDDLWLRFSVLEALSRIGRGVPIAPIAALLGDKFLRKAVFAALGSTLEPRAIKYLLTGLRDRGRTTRAAAVVNLVRIYKLLKTDEAEKVEAAIRNDADSVLLEELLDSPSRDVKEGAVILLGVVGGIEDPRGLLGLVRDETLQAVVAMALLKMGSKVSGALSGVYEESDEKTRAFICAVLGAIGDPGALTVLKGALKDRYGHARKAALLSIGKLGGGGILPEILPLLSDEYEDVQEAAVSVVAMIGKGAPEDVLEGIRGILKDDDSVLRRNATAVLGGIGTGEVLPLVVISLRDAASDVRRVAVSVLGLLAMKDALDHFPVALADEDRAVRLAAVNALGSFDPEDTEKLFLLAAKDEDVWVRCAALKGLSKTGSKSSYDLIVSSIMDGAGVVAITAIDALYDMKGSDAVEVLKRGLSHRDPRVVMAVEDKLRNARKRL